MARIAKFELPDGRTGQLEIPEGATQEAIEAAIQEATGFTGQQPAPVQPEQAPSTFMDRLKAFGKDVAPKNMMEATNPMLTMGKGVMKGLDFIQQEADIGAEKIAENTDLIENPTIRGLVAGTLANAPDIALSAIPIGKAKALAKGAKAIPAAARRTMLAAPKAETARVALEKAREFAKVPETLETVFEPRTRKAIIDFAKKTERLAKKSAQELVDAADPQTIAQLRDTVKRLLRSQNVAKQGKEMKQLVDKSTLGRLVNFSEKLTEAMKIQNPSLRQPMAESAASLRRSNLLQSLGKRGKQAATGAAVGIPLGAVLRMFGIGGGK